MSRHLDRQTLTLAGSILMIAVAAAAQPPQQPEVRNLYIGEESPSAEALRSRAEQQIARAKSRLEVFAEFGFRDELLSSGIKFRHQPTDDGIKNYAMVHYDHGNALLVADVDGDDRHDLYFLTQVGRNELWRNVGEGRFEDITDTAGVALADRICVAGAFADYDNDGDADLFVTTVRTGNVLLQNDGTGRFRDVSQSAGVAHVGHSSGSIFFDYDRDGWLDLFVTNVGRYTTDVRGPGGYYVGVEDAFSGHLKPERFERSLLYRNRGDGTFVDVSKHLGLDDLGWSGDATPIDVDHDGWLDLYVLNMQGDDHLWINQQGKHFAENTAPYFPKTPWGAMGVKVFDFDNNGLMDLLLTDMHSDMSEAVELEREKSKSRMPWKDEYLQGGDNNLFGNGLYQQVEPGRFVEVSDSMGVENYWPWGVSVDDINADGWDDVLITSSMNYPYRYGVNSLLLNNAGQQFVDSEFLLGLEPRVHGMTMRPWFSVDCSGADREHRICQENALQGQYLVWGTLGSRTAAIFDLDADGDLDMVIGEFNSQPLVMVSDLAARKPIRYLTVRLRGTQSNRDGLGAVVTLVAGERRLTKVLDGKSGYLSQSRLPLYFGLGDAPRVDRIEVQWPSGGSQVVTPGPSTNRLVEITESHD